jgi:hypothetical protein
MIIDEKKANEEIRIQIPEKFNLKVESIFSEEKINPHIYKEDLIFQMDSEFQAMAVLFELH